MNLRGLPGLILLAGIALLAIPSAVVFYTDWLWFDSVGETEVFTVTLTTRLALFGSFGLTMAVVLAGTL